MQKESSLEKPMEKPIEAEDKPLKEVLKDMDLATVPDSLPLIALADIPDSRASSSSARGGSPHHELHVWPCQKTDAGGFVVWDDESEDNAGGVIRDDDSEDSK